MIGTVFIRERPVNRPPEVLHLQAELLELDGSDDGLANGTKADLQAAKRLAKRLYNLEGFRKSDVARHLSKKSVRMCTSPPPTVAWPLLGCWHLFGVCVFTATSSARWSWKNTWATLTSLGWPSTKPSGQLIHHYNIDYNSHSALFWEPARASEWRRCGLCRMFLRKFALIGETQERERVLAHFSKTYRECNRESETTEGTWLTDCLFVFCPSHRLSILSAVIWPVSFSRLSLSDSIHTLTCAVMLLNTDLHGNVSHIQAPVCFLDEFWVVKIRVSRSWTKTPVN